MNHPYSGVICFLFVYIGVVTGFSDRQPILHN